MLFFVEKIIINLKQWKITLVKQKSELIKSIRTKIGFIKERKYHYFFFIAKSFK